MMQDTIFYRHFDLPKHFPVIGLLGNTWQSTSEQEIRQHFHNCLEIGFLFEGKGELFAGEQVIPFEAPCLLLLPPRLGHANRAAEGCVCRWNWLYLDPQTLLTHLAPRPVLKFSIVAMSTAGGVILLFGV